MKEKKQTTTPTERIQKMHIRNLVQKIIDGKVLSQGQLKIVEEYYKTQEPHKYARTLKALGAAIGVSGKTMFQWTKRTGFPPKEKAGWNIEACRAFRDEVLMTAADRRGRGNGGAGDLTALQQVRMKKMEQEIEALGLRLARRRGELIPVQEVREGFTFLTTQFLAALDNLLNRIGNECKGTPKVIEIVRNAIAAVRYDLERCIRNGAATMFMRRSDPPA